MDIKEEFVDPKSLSMVNAKILKHEYFNELLSFRFDILINSTTLNNSCRFYLRNEKRHR